MVRASDSFAWGALAIGASGGVVLGLAAGVLIATRRTCELPSPTTPGARTLPAPAAHFDGPVNFQGPPRTIGAVIALSIGDRHALRCLGSRV